jgi:hypothetical protein
MAFISLELVAGLVAVILLVAVVLNRPRKDGLPLPPGPPKRPLVGNIPDMPEKEAFLAFDKWKKEYGASLLLGRICATYARQGTSCICNSVDKI